MYQYRLQFSEAVRECFSRYCCFSGRAARSEYWWWVLFNFIIATVLGILAAIFNGSGSQTFFNIVGYAISLAFLLPGLGVTVRRLHDIGRGGGWIFLGLIPVVGSIILLIWFCQASQTGANRFGEEPNMRPIGR